ncbi:hypothetical protein [Glaciihabitans sp. dw_435]|uniref:hypothetical protein n=1 Tax=Glaciihabitans sp. dw_435 TaxID=2720081 RepID=UPI001BD38210|nr:hypothetical protein [Glaciihabitans sp. dw_435]
MSTNPRARKLAPFLTVATVAALLVGGLATPAFASPVVPVDPTSAVPSSDPTVTADPTESPAPIPSTEPTTAPVPTVEPTLTPDPTASPAPTVAPDPAVTTAPTTVPDPAVTSDPTVVPDPAVTTAPPVVPAPTNSVDPTPTPTPEPTSTSVPVPPVTALTGLTLKASTSVFPSRDGYRDTATVVVTPSTEKGAKIAITGDVVISTQTKKTVATWPLTSSSPRTIGWSGLVGGKIVPGKYIVTVAAKGTTGKSFVRSAVIVVSKQKLVAKVWSKWVDANAVVTEAFSFDDKTHCSFSGNVVCSADTTANLLQLGTILGGYVPLPKAIVESAAFTLPSVRVTMDVDKFTRGASLNMWTISGDSDDLALAALKKGNTRLGWTMFDPRDPDLGIPAVSAILGVGSSITIDRFLVEYSYKALS